MTAEPHPADAPSLDLAGRGVLRTTKRLFLATRPAFFTASALPVLVGTVWARAQFGQFDALAFGLALLATVLAHAAVNVYNDVGDDQIGADQGNTQRIYPYMGARVSFRRGLCLARRWHVLPRASGLRRLPWV